jgi:hydrogenase maturation protein HypF
VGFRPFVYRLAAEMELGGTVANNSNGAVIEIEGPAERLEAFGEELIRRLPPLAHVSDLRQHEIATRGETTFRIERSQHYAECRPEVTPDAATCRDCLNELFEPNDRRHRYPFINCTNCGPRYSIIRTVPYDRPATTMAEFELCEPCRREYEDPADRRFHAQPNACPACGPQLQLLLSDSSSVDGDPIAQAARMLSEGKILAVKGIGGYHLACRADRQNVVESLRIRKLRDGKPLAVMVPDVEHARRVCRLTQADIDALSSPAAPIVLAPKNDGHGLADAVAPHCRDFGIFLPYAPVHHLLFAEGLGPLVLTSANLAGQPLTYEDDDALATLGDVADAFLMHNRRIFRPIDDSVVLTFRETVAPIRRARGYAPRPIRLDTHLRHPQSWARPSAATKGGTGVSPVREPRPTNTQARRLCHPGREESSRAAKKNNR